MLITTGTPEGCWTGWAGPLLEPWRALAPPGSVAGVDPGGDHALRGVAQEFPAARFLVFVERPALGLAAGLAAAATDSPERWLARWKDAARALLRHAQQFPGRSLLVETEEAMRAPAALVEAVEGLIGPRPEGSGPALPEPPAIEPVALALAEALCFADRDAMALLAELRACCLPLADLDALPLLESVPRIDAAAAARGLAELLAARSDAQRLSEDEVRRELELGRIGREFQALERQLADALEDREARERLEQASRDRIALLEQAVERYRAELDQLRRERDARLEAEVAARREVELRLGRVQAESQAQAEQLLRQRTEVAEKARAEHAAAIDKARGEHAAALAAVRQENELLLVQLHQVQEELEQYYLANLDLARKAAQRAAGSLLELSIGSVAREGERDARPYRELSFTLREVKAGSREIPEAQVRLVEHRGHPGLVVFGNPSGPQLLESWGGNGVEGERPYMLLVPDDLNCRSLFDAMPSADWMIVLAVAARLEAELAQAPGGNDPWRQLARRLQEALLEMPRRFRYDTLQLERIDGVAPPALRLDFAGVSCGARQRRRMTVEWRAGGAEAALGLLADAVEGPPLPAWPEDASGAVPGRLDLPIAPAAPAALRRERWMQLAPADRDFALALLEALPLAVAGAADPAAAGAGSATAMRDLAAAQLEATRALVAPGPARAARTPLMRRLAMRLGLSPAT